MSDIQAIVKGIARLKPFPQTLHRILELARDPKLRMPDLAEAISNDPMLTANILRDVNSAYYGRTRKCETVHQAVVYLGVSEVINLALMGGARQNLIDEQPGYDLESGELWRYSLTSAFLGRDVAERAGLEDPQLVFTAGLLKDIGKAVLASHVSDELPAIRELVDSEGYSFREAERAVLGIDHAQLGALVAEEWQFSDKLRELIGTHHLPLQCESAPLEAAAVYLGDVLCMMLGVGVGADGLAYRFQEQATELLGLSDTDLQRILADFALRMERLEALFDTDAPRGQMR